MTRTPLTLEKVTSDPLAYLLVEDANKTAVALFGEAHFVEEIKDYSNLSGRNAHGA